MSKLIPRLFFLTILFFVFPIISFAQVTQINFTTEPQSIKPDTLSSPITIQTQDSGGNPFQTPETMDIQFISSSGTGQFLNSSGEPATAYMSRNTANRTFYYKDQSEGVFTITVNVRGRESGIELDTSQTITVSSDTSQNPADTGSNTSGEVLGATNVSSTKQSDSGGGSLTKASSLNSQLEIVAGNDRTTTPGSPIWFQATVKKNTTSAGIDLNWSFGDGYIGIGPLVNHTYKYAGDYVVVLSAKAGDIFSVSRLKVKVLDPSLSVLDKGNYLEIKNNSGAEINLFNWKIESGGRGFIFQPNTIVSAYSFIRLDKKLLNMKGYDNSLGLVLKNSLAEEVFSTSPPASVDLKEASKNLDNIKNELSAIQEKAKAINIKPVKNVATVMVGQKTESSADLALPKEGTSTEDLIYEGPKVENFFKRTWRFIAGLFD